MAGNAVPSKMWLVSGVQTIICFLFVHVQVTKQEVVQPSHQDVMNAVLNVFEDKLTDLLEDKLTDIFEDKLSDFMENKLTNLLESKMVKLLENNLPDLLAEQLSDVHYRLRKMEDTLVNVKDDLAIISKISLPMYTKIEDIEKRSSQTLISIEEGKLVQEQTLSEISDANQNISYFIQTVNVKAVSLEENFREVLNETSEFLQNKIEKLHNSSAEVIMDNVEKIGELRNSSIEAIKHNSLKFQEIHNAFAENVMETNKSCLAPFEKNTTLGCVYLVNTEVSWWNANVECMVMGAQLMVNPPRAYLLSYITDKGYTSTTQLWIGGKHYDNWRWLNRDIISEGWADGEPDANQSTECVYFNYDGHDLLYDHSCEKKKKFICEIP
ncbi:unnamed protein product [Meganyctiphanes norvegica]|uniref:C-type lectin domain-containing protein n=1 Tax=Meganyctiphanes norvegica TaxID=48144 RepID=A0AAV2S614_MEGNR